MSTSTVPFTAAASAQPAVRLSSGHTFPLLGFGTWGGGDDAATISNAVQAAITSGYSHVDCAQFYRNETEIGAVLGPHFATHPRASLFITSKLWNTNHHPSHVAPSVRKSISDLQCQHLDLLLIHWPVALRHTGLDFSDGGGVPMKDGKLDWAQPGVPILDTWRAMEALVDEGVVKSIGVSNFPLILLNDLLAGARIPPAVNQVENHPYLAQNNLLSFCRQHSVHLSGYSPLGRPGRTKEESVIHDATVKSLAAELSAASASHSATAYSPACVLLAWNVLREVSVLPKSSTPERIEHNLHGTLALLAQLQANPAQKERFVQQLNALDRGLRYCNMHLTGPNEGAFQRIASHLFE